MGSNKLYRNMPMMIRGVKLPKANIARITYPTTAQSKGFIANFAKLSSVDVEILTFVCTDSILFVTFD